MRRQSVDIVDRVSSCSNGPSVRPHWKFGFGTALAAARRRKLLQLSDLLHDTYVARGSDLVMSPVGLAAFPFCINGELIAGLTQSGTSSAV